MPNVTSGKPQHRHHGLVLTSSLFGTTPSHTALQRVIPPPPLIPLKAAGSWTVSKSGPHVYRMLIAGSIKQWANVLRGALKSEPMC